MEASIVTVNQRWFAFVLLAVSALLVYLLQPILMPFLVGALLGYLGDPVTDRLEAMGLNRTGAVCVVFLGFTVLLLLTLLVTLPIIGHQFDILIRKLPQWLEFIHSSILPWLQQRLDLSQGTIDAIDYKSLISQNWLNAGQLLTRVSQHLAGSSMALVALLANLMLIPVVTFYLLRDWDVLVARLRDLLPRDWEPTIVSLTVECDEILGAFIRGQLLVMMALAGVYSLGLWVVGLELALLLGLIAGLASIVPYLGFIVGIVAATVAAYFQFHEWQPLFWVAVVFGIGQVLESTVFTPLLVGDRIGLHPVAVIFAIMAGGQLAGFTGILLALPLAAVVMVWLRHLHDRYKDSALYRSP
jgi:predicted PurR-regulated permease PerM